MSRSLEMRECGRQRGSRFLLQDVLGRGGMCEVYSAIDLVRVEYGDSRPEVAVKCLLPEVEHLTKAQLTLAQEFFTLRHLFHSGVVRAYDLHCEEGGLCFSMELLRGVSGADILARRPDGLGFSGVSVAARIFGTLSYLHANGVIHGDVKPSNVFLEQRGRPVLIDFNTSRNGPHAVGLNVAFGRGDEDAVRIPGLSVLHASPERLAGAPATLESDIFSACSTVYELLTGYHPFKRLNAQVAVQQGVEPRRPAFLGRRRWRWLRDGLNCNPGRRPAASRLQDVFEDHGWFGGFTG